MSDKVIRAKLYLSVSGTRAKLYLSVSDKDIRAKLYLSVSGTRAKLYLSVRQGHQSKAVPVCVRYQS